MATFNNGQLGVAEKAIRSRKDRLDGEEAKATNTSDKPEPKKEDKPVPRPPMSRKW